MYSKEEICQAVEAVNRGRLSLREAANSKSGFKSKNTTSFVDACAITAKMKQKEKQQRLEVACKEIKTGEKTM